ncbi:TPA: hypothetical protein JI314_20070, partial [Acinetobacter baumannii]|nr:hypothetical protein [Acinetobacter baumannii]
VKILLVLSLALLPVIVDAKPQATKEQFNKGLFERDMEIAQVFQELTKEPNNGLKTCYAYSLLKEKHNYIASNTAKFELQDDYSLQKVILSEKPLIAQFKSIITKNGIPCDVN